MEMSLEKEEEEFLANICQGGRVTVPLAYRERLRLKQGTRVRKCERETPPVLTVG